MTSFDGNDVTLSRLFDAELAKGEKYWLSSALASWRGGWRRVTCTSVGPKWVTFMEPHYKPYKLPRASADYRISTTWVRS